MVTILGQHISLIRPSLGHQNKVYKNERPRSKYNQRPITNEQNTGKVIAICVKLMDGGIKSIPTPATHIDVCEQLSLDLSKIVQTGWKLENGNYLWR